MLILFFMYFLRGKSRDEMYYFVNKMEIKMSICFVNGNVYFSGFDGDVGGKCLSIYFN